MYTKSSKLSPGRLQSRCLRILTLLLQNSGCVAEGVPGRRGQSGEGRLQKLKESVCREVGGLCKTREMSPEMEN